MVRSLEAEGVTTVFGYPGAAICPFYDSLAGSSIHHVLVRQEQHAGHAASGWARACGGVGVCVATSGPGALNLMTAIATAYMDSIPLVAITGQVSSELLGRDSFQEADITGACVSFTKHRYLVNDARTLPRIFKEAFYLASTGRKGPVLIDVPIDVQRASLDFEYPEKASLRSYNPNVKGHAVQIRRALEALEAAERPLICAGGGVFGAGAERTLLDFAERGNIPVITTMMGLGAMPSEHPLFMGMLGMFGSRCSNRALAECDTLLIAGARVGDRAMSTPELLARDKTVIHIDIDPAEIGKNMGASIPIVGDLALVLGQIYEGMSPMRHDDWLSSLNRWRSEESAESAARRDENSFEPVSFVRALTSAMPEGGILVADVGQNQLWSAAGFSVRHGRFLTSGGMGTMGYSLPAAIGAKLARPEKTVAAICGDGALQMEMCELATMVQERAAVKYVVMRNSCLGMIREIQDKSYGGRHTAIELDGLPDIGKLAAAYGLPYMRISENSETPAGVKFLLETEGPAVLECVVPPETATAGGRFKGGSAR